MKSLLGKRKGAQQVMFVIAFLTLAILMLALWYTTISGLFEDKIAQLLDIF